MDKEVLSLDLSVIEQEARYDGFYVVCTNLEGPVEDIIQCPTESGKLKKRFAL